MAQLAHARSHQVYLIDPLRLVHYRHGVGQRVKADRQDAQLVARYLEREVCELRLWQPETLPPTKQGDPEVHRLLFNAAMQRRRNPLWEPYYLSLRQRGMSTTAAFVALGRKLARVCFALLKNGTEFNPRRRAGACAAT